VISNIVVVHDYISRVIGSFSHPQIVGKQGP
jgi:hypothetical protein